MQEKAKKISEKCFFYFFKSGFLNPCFLEKSVKFFKFSRTELSFFQVKFIERYNSKYLKIDRIDLYKSNICGFCFLKKIKRPKGH